MVSLIGGPLARSVRSRRKPRNGGWREDCGIDPEERAWWRVGAPYGVRYRWRCYAPKELGVSTADVGRKDGIPAIAHPTEPADKLWFLAQLNQVLCRVVIGDPYRLPRSCHGVGWISRKPDVGSLVYKRSTKTGAHSSFSQAVIRRDKVITRNGAVFGLLVYRSPCNDLCCQVIGDAISVEGRLIDGAPIKRFKEPGM